MVKTWKRRLVRRFWPAGRFGWRFTWLEAISERPECERAVQYGRCVRGSQRLLCGLFLRYPVNGWNRWQRRSVCRCQE